REVFGSHAQRGKNRMRSDPPKPVGRVGKVRFATMHDAVPVATLRRGDGLTEMMRFVQKVVQQPQAGKAGTSGVRPAYLLGREEFVDRQPFQLLTHCSVGLSRTQGAQPIFRKQLPSNRRKSGYIHTVVLYAPVADLPGANTSPGAFFGLIRARPFEYDG